MTKTVRIGAFELGAWPVTNAEYAQFVEGTGHAPPPFWKQQAFAHPSQPVVGVSWFDAVAYCAWLGRGYRLPTEAEWEHAARGGIEGALYPWGNDPRAGYATRRMDGPDLVAQSAPNGYGLYDMCENIHEWCSDWYDPPACTRRASRGGAWRHQIKISRCDARSSLPPHLKYSDYGFRVARWVHHSTQFCPVRLSVNGITAGVGSSRCDAYGGRTVRHVRRLDVDVGVDNVVPALVAVRVKRPSASVGSRYTP